MSEVKFREFWIRWHKHWDENNYTDVITDVMTIKRYDDDIHVVEIAALAAKDAEIELVRNTYRLELDKLKSELAEKDAVLEFCALGETQWDGVEAMHKAREVLQKFLPERNIPNATTK